MLIRKLEKRDLDTIGTINTACFSMPWSRASVEQELTNPLASYFVAEDERYGRVMGYIGAHIVCDTAYITNVAVDENYRRVGAAYALINALEKVSQELSCEFMTLEVRESNFAAVKLYEKTGFELMGKRPRFYERPSEDALIYTKKL